MTRTVDPGWELRFDARVVLPEAQERFQRAEAEAERLRAALSEILEVTREVPQPDDTVYGIAAAALIDPADHAEHFGYTPPSDAGLSRSPHRSRGSSPAAGA